jgi:hypothetical protein
MPTVGERHQEPGMVLANEWTGEAWTSVCPVDDVPMLDRQWEGELGWLACQVCGRRHNELADMARVQQ